MFSNVYVTWGSVFTWVRPHQSSREINIFLVVLQSGRFGIIDVRGSSFFLPHPSLEHYLKNGCIQSIFEF